MFENKELLIATIFNFALQYAIWNVHLNREGLQMSGNTATSVWNKYTECFISR